MQREAAMLPEMDNIYKDHFEIRCGKVGEIDKKRQYL